MKSDKSPLKAIRKHCLDCSGGRTSAVRLCTTAECPLYPYRFGFNPYNKNARKGLLNKLAEAKKETLEKNPDLEKETFYPEISI